MTKIARYDEKGFRVFIIFLKSRAELVGRPAGMTNDKRHKFEVVSSARQL